MFRRFEHKPVVLQVSVKKTREWKPGPRGGGAQRYTTTVNTKTVSKETKHH